jgi:hypothetical protein
VCFSVASQWSLESEWKMRWTDARGAEVARQVFDLTYGLYVTCAGDSNRYLVNATTPTETCKPWLSLVGGSPDPTYLECVHVSDQSCGLLRTCGARAGDAGRDGLF